MGAVDGHFFQPFLLFFLSYVNPDQHQSLVHCIARHHHTAVAEQGQGPKPTPPPPQRDVHQTPA